MTVEKLKEWVEYCGYKYSRGGKNDLHIELNKDYEKHKQEQKDGTRSVSGTGLRHICTDGHKVFLDSNRHGIPYIEIPNREYLKLILEQ